MQVTAGLLGGSVTAVTHVTKAGSRFYVHARNVAAALLFLVFAPDFLGLFGTAYTAGVPVLMLLAFGQLIPAGPFQSVQILNPG